MRAAIEQCCDVAEARAASSGATEGDYPQGSGSDAWGRSHAAMGSEVGHGQGGGQAQADQQQPLAIPVQHRSQVSALHLGRRSRMDVGRGVPTSA